MKKLVYSTCVVLFLFSFTIGEQSSPLDKPQQSTEDECWTPGRPKPDVEVGRNAPVLCGKAISLPKPPYPEEAKARKISGLVQVNIVIDETGRVIWAEAVEGDPLLREVSVKAACNSRHSPMKISERAVKVASVITYNFLSEDSPESSDCSQPDIEREQLMQRAEKEKFTLRRVEFLGLTHTSDKTVRRRMASFNEGDLFSRKRLFRSLANMSTPKSEIYPVRLNDVRIRLNDPDKTVDLEICFKPKRR